MANKFDVYNDGVLVSHTEGDQDDQNYVTVTIDNLTPNTTYDKLMIVSAGEDISNAVPLPTITTS